ncbi:GvpL/GvpF family gas vesicle protein [Streptomyces sp. NPDC048111]|uniref:GvpL/GvpF family gas vesicle protein n=1 Tax=Streptomyces sp. NPDC048111 TaxID=3365500 RepID=UPI00372305C0
MPPDASTLTYVYAAAFLTQPLREALTELHGVYGAPLHTLTAAPGTAPGATGPPLAFVAGRVPAADFNERALKAHFEDLQWLEAVARAHHDVVQALATRATVLPLRMATLYQDDDRARQALLQQHASFTARLAQLDAHKEFGVKLYLAPLAGPSAPGQDTGGQDTGGQGAASATPGKTYLRRRRAEHQAVEARYGQARRAAGELEAIAARYATHRVRHAVQSGALTGPAENVLNDAYLVPDEDAERFRAAVEQAAEAFDGLRVEVTGPWAPYSFAAPPPEQEPYDAFGPEGRRP